MENPKMRWSLEHKAKGQSERVARLTPHQSRTFSLPTNELVKILQRLSTQT